MILVLAACRSVAPVVEPVSVEASRAFEQARSLERAGNAERAEEMARRAATLAPDWVAPLRWLDDRARASLLGPAALAQHRAALREDPRDARAAYLAGRLEADDQRARFRAAVRADRDLAWGHHGLAHVAASEGRWREAVREQQLARDLARDSWERVYFAIALARHLTNLDRADEATELLRKGLDVADLHPRDRAELELQLCRALLRSEESWARTEGYHRARAWLRSGVGSRADARELCRAALDANVTPSRRERELDLERTLRERGDEALLARHLRESGLGDLADRLDEPDARPPTAEEILREGDVRAWIDAWLAGLPPQVVRDGLPADRRLREVVELARAAAEEADVEAWTKLGRALLDAGWFDEALALSRRIAPLDLARAEELREGAAAALAWIGHFQELLRAVATGAPRGGADARELNGLEGLLEASQPFVDELAAARPSAAADAWQLGESPFSSFGPAGRVLHPGPWYHAADARRGRGEAGEPVPGWASLWHALGRFPLVGQALGRRPEGVILRLLHVEDRAGEHLGAPWEGTVAWCLGRERDGRAPMGDHIAGAAMHQGYWIDVAVVRRQAWAWRAMHEAWFGAGADPARAAAAITVPAIEVEPGASPADWIAPLGEAARVQLAVLAERGTPPTLGELVAFTARHEEGHLCDRARFLPLSRNFLRTIGFLASQGFSPEAVLRRFEYRAQAIAMCVVEDPRVALVETLGAAETNGDGAHATAYRDLTEDMLFALARDPGLAPQLDRTRYLVHQFHRMSAEDVRAVALAVARREGLVER